MKCLNCNEELEQTNGKRERKFCGSTCRSNYWQKQQVLKRGKIVSAKIEKENNKPVAKLVIEVDEKGNGVKISDKTNFDKKPKETSDKNLSYFEQMRKKKLGW